MTTVFDEATIAYVLAEISGLSGVYIPLTDIGAANGVASLNASGKIPLGQLPADVFIYQGTWSPSTNTPALADGTGTAGSVYWVSVAAAGPVAGLNNASMVNFQIGDLVVYNGTQWQLTTPAAGVQSVNGAQGAVTVNAINRLTGDVQTATASGSQSEASTIESIQGTTVAGTTGTGNVMFSVSPTTTGTLTAAAITASAEITGTASGAGLSITNNALIGGTLAIGTTATQATFPLQVKGQINGANGTLTGVPYSAVEHSQGLAYSGGITAIFTGGPDTVGALNAITINGTRGSAEVYGIITEAAFSGSDQWNAGSPTALQNGDYLSGIAFAGQCSSTAGTGMVIGACITGQVVGSVSSGHLPTDLVFRTSETTNSGLTEQMRIDSAGLVGIATSTPGYQLHVVGEIYGSAGYVGTATNSSATTGTIGEFISANPGSAVTPGATGVFVNVVSVSLTAGDWDVESVIVLTEGATSAVTSLAASISTSSAAQDSTNNGGIINTTAVPGALASTYLPTGARRVSLASTTTIYLVAAIGYSVLGGATYGTDSFIRARRMS